MLLLTYLRVIALQAVYSITVIWEVGMVSSEIWILNLKRGRTAHFLKILSSHLAFTTEIPCTKLQFCVLIWIVIARYRFSINDILWLLQWFDSAYMQYHIPWVPKNTKYQVFSRYFNFYSSYLLYGRTDS